MRGCSIAVIDTETTGTSRLDRVVEVAVIRIDGLLEPGAPAPVVALETLVRPDVAADHRGWWNGTTVHGIQERHVRRAPTWDEAWPLVLHAIRGAVLCAYNAGFDRRMLVQHCEATGQPTGDLPPIEDWLDPLPWVRAVDGERARGKGCATLEAACARRRIPYGGHRAGGDARSTASLVLGLIRQAYRLEGELAPPREPTIRQWLAWQRLVASATAPGKGGAKGKGKAGAATALPAGVAGAPPAVPALPLVVAEQQASLEGDGGGRAPRRTAAERMPWRIRGTEGHLVGMWLTNGRGQDGSWRWTMRPSHARRFELESEAVVVAHACKGRVERADAPREPWLKLPQPAERGAP